MTTQELNEKVQRMIEKGCKLPVEQIEAILLKGSKVSSSSAKGFERRAAIEANPIVLTKHSDDLYAEASLRQRPSSMR